MKATITPAIRAKKRGRVTLQAATEAIGKILGEMSDHSDFQAEMIACKKETIFVFTAGDVCATLHVQPIARPRKKGGAKCQNSKL